MPSKKSPPTNQRSFELCNYESLEAEFVNERDGSVYCFTFDRGMNVVTFDCVKASRYLIHKS